jgi:transcriptional regulator with XRE-family HTH domain
MRPVSPLPILVKKALLKLGSDLRDARIRRRISMSLMAERAMISRTTLTKVEKGDPSVAFGIYATVIFVLGLVKRIDSLLDLTNDELGMVLDEQRLPKRVRHSKPKKQVDVKNEK